MVFDVRYLKPAHLIGFENYKYNSVDSSPLSNYVMHPFWNSVVKVCPRSVAPNLLTLTGFLLTLANFLLLSVFDYQFLASCLGSKPQVPAVPRWVWLFAALALFLSHTLDGIDGKQARRLGMTGPLGELFDHGLDSWSSYLIPITVFSVLGRLEFSIPPMRMLLVLWNVWLSFLLSHWEKYCTGVLFLPWGYDLSQLGVLILYLCTFFWDYTVWKFSLWMGSDGRPLVTSGQLLEVLMWLGCLGTGLPVTVWNIYKSYRDGTGKQRGLGDALLPLLSPALLLCISFMWAWLSPSDVLNSDFRLFSVMIGTVFSNICCRLIVAQMSGTTVESVNRLLLPVLLTAALAVLYPQSQQQLASTAAAPTHQLGNAAVELWALWLLTAGVLLAHLHYGICVVRQMSHHFKIPALTVKKRID